MKVLGRLAEWCLNEAEDLIAAMAVLGLLVALLMLLGVEIDPFLQSAFDF